MPGDRLDRQRVLQQYVRQMVSAGSPQAIVLFGSSARGRAGPDSDFDLLIIEDTDLPPTRRGIGYRLALHPRLVPIDLIVRTPSEVKSALRAGPSFLGEALREGLLLYGQL